MTTPRKAPKVRPGARSIAVGPAPFRWIPAGLGLLLATTSGGFAAEWVELTLPGQPGPSARVHAASIYDPVGHRMVVFGGSTAAGDVGDVWAYGLGGSGWTQLSTGGGPSGRITANAVSDAIHHRILIWAGQSAGTFNNDVWAFDLATNGWTELVPPDPRPNIRYGTAAVLDPVTRDLVTYAGFTDAGRFDDTWRFAIDEVAWSDVSPATNPGRRCLHSSSLDERGRRMIVYGGQRSAALGDIWSLDLATGLWTELTPPTRPANRFFAPQAYDARRHSATVFGGNLNGTYSNETWAFDLTAVTWSQIVPAGTRPAAREGATAIYVVSEDRLIVFGGGTPLRQGDIWALELSPGETLPFVESIVALDPTTFAWPVTQRFDWVRGDLADLADYTTHRQETGRWGTTLEDTETPQPGTGFWYLLRPSGARGTWQSTPGSDPARDAALP